jgi:hypothetical protein
MALVLEYYIINVKIICESSQKGATSILLGNLYEM